MRKLALILMLAAFAIFVAVPTFACDGHKSSQTTAQKTASKDCSSTCAGKASCPAMAAGKDCPSTAGCVCPYAKGAKTTTADAKGTSDMTVTPAVAKSEDKVSVNLTGEGCTAGKTAGKTCTAEEMAKCGMKGEKTTAKLPNGHSAISVAEAMKCEKGSMVAFLSVDKMTCQGCVSHVSKTLGTFDGVCAVDVDLKKASATVVFHPDKVKTDDMIAAVNKAGYTASMKTECTEDMKAVFGENYKDMCTKSCANTCKEKQESKKSSDS